MYFIRRTYATKIVMLFIDLLNYLNGITFKLHNIHLDQHNQLLLLEIRPSH